MTKRTIISDLHIGVQRSGGTTSETASALRQFALERYKSLLTLGHHFLVNGDMFDTYNIPLHDLLMAYQITADWLLQDPDNKIDLVPGNHCLSKNSANLSSFELMARLLMARFHTQVRYLQGGLWVDESEGLYVISHMPNQELFELELSRVPEGTKTLFLHCNFDNEFAGQADHSLNLARDQAKLLTKRDITIVMGHEHQGRTSLGDKVIIVGNQFPTSVSDCLTHGDGQKDGRKYCLQIDGDDMELIPTWSFKDDVGGFAEVDWQDLASAPKGQKFIRVSGNCVSAQSADVIKAISKLRQSSEAFVITNAVKIEGVAGVADLAESVEDIRSVNVISMLLETLDDDQKVVVRKLLLENANG